MAERGEAGGMSDHVRWEIVHRSVFAYNAEVVESQNELRACPCSDDVQTLLHHHTVLVPTARVNAYTDYWGTRVETFGVRGTHERLEVVAESTVQVHDRPSAPGVVPLEALGADGLRDEHGELLAQTGMVAWGDALEQWAADVTDGHDDVWSVALALRDDVAARVVHDPDSTRIGTPVEEVLATARGVAQDRAHLMAAGCRARGVPARYVSGYRAPSGDVPTVTHAWVEVAVPGEGWHALDPSTTDAVGRRYVTIGRGRDYGDVPPLRGAFVGGEDHELTVEVEMTGGDARSSQAQQQGQQQQ